MARKRPLIVLADDDAAIIELLSDLLADEGYETICCSRGTDAYAVIQRDQPDFVILDMQMEQRDAGLIVLSLMRLSPKMIHIPVLICSADGVFLREKAAQLDAYQCAVLEKPFLINQLLAKVWAAIGKPNEAV